MTASTAPPPDAARSPGPIQPPDPPGGAFDPELEGEYWWRLRAFVDGHATLAETAAWRDAHLAEITDSRSWVLGEMDGVFAFHLCEYHLSRRRPDEVRAALGDDLLAVVTPPGLAS